MNQELPGRRSQRNWGWIKYRSRIVCIGTIIAAHFLPVGMNQNPRGVLGKMDSHQSKTYKRK